jgi:hypothetical protein
MFNDAGEQWKDDDLGLDDFVTQGNRTDLESDRLVAPVSGVAHEM